MWEQHTRYFKARGEVRNPRQMFLVDLLSLLWQWKAVGNKILLIGDFNKNVYTGTLAEALLRDNFRMLEVCQRTTGLLFHHPITEGWLQLTHSLGLQESKVQLLPSFPAASELVTTGFS